jgi:HEAT repeat protein
MRLGEVRAPAATALADIEARESTAALIAAAADPEVARCAANASPLGEIGDPAVHADAGARRDGRCRARGAILKR